MISIELSGPILVATATLGTVWIYRNAECHTMDTADIRAVGFFVVSVLLPVLGGLAVFVFCLRN